MAGLSYITTGTKVTPDLNLSVPTDESIGAMLFDISGFDSPFSNYPLLYNKFKDNTIQCIYSMDDASLLGITNDGFLNGVLYYHVKQFYDFIGEDKTLYICIADCSKDWDVIQYMQQQVSGKLFQIGVWTSQPIWKLNSDGSMGFTSLIPDLQSQAEEVGGKPGVRTFTTVPINIILFGNSNYIGGDTVNYKNIPDALVLDCPKVSVALIQNGSDEAHAMQEANPNSAPVGALGVFMACLAICGAEESIASLKKCDLNKDEAFNYPEWGLGNNYTPIDEVNIVRAEMAASKGYIIPMSYDGLEACYFFSGDQTLSDGDYGTIHNNRVMHKCRRAACTALLPYVNSDQIYDPSTQNISVTAISLITDSINTIIDSVMRNADGQAQIDGRTVTFLDSDDLLNSDSINIKLTITPVDSNDELSEMVSAETE